MFSTKEKLIKRTGYNDVPRYDYLKLLISEFEKTKSRDHKEQVLANLANFAYDPINYGYIRQLRIIDLFLHNLSENNEKLVRFAIGGICNLCLDPINKLYINRNQGVKLISNLLFSTDEETVLSAITTLMFLMSKDSEDEITSLAIKQQIVKLSSNESIRIKNLSSIFLKDYCRISPRDSETEVEEEKS